MENSKIETSKGKMTGTITADPNMPPETMKALTTMMGLLGEMAMRGELNAILKERLTYGTAQTDSECRQRLVAVAIRSLFVGLGTVGINMQIPRK